MDYFELQKTVFDHLWNKHKQDNNFTFSVRQKASKGAETNHFIGKKKSSYFGFTCWDIPVYFPGSSADLTNFIFTVKERCFVRFQYGGMIKTQTDPQSVGDLAFGYELLKNLQAAGLKVSPHDEKNKILYYYLELDGKGYDNTEDILRYFEALYTRVAPIVDSSIAIIKNTHPDWQAGRYLNPKFNNLIQRMYTRLEKFAAGTLPKSEIEEEEDDTEEILSGAIANTSHPLNIILYGPPGTGKTYHTVNKAIAIANPDFILEGKSRKEIKAEYNRLVEAKQIQFVTFHQSMSYEDFIEGIKPVEPKEVDTFLKYRVEDGIFKRLVEQASYVPDEQEASVYLSEEDFGKAAFYGLGLNTALQPGDKAIYNYCIENNCIALNVAEGFDANGKAEAIIKSEARNYPSGEAAALARLVHHVKAGNYVLLCDGDSTCRAIGRVTGDYQFKPNDEITPDHFRPVEWLVKGVQIPKEQIYDSSFNYGIERLDRNEVKKDFFTKKTVARQPSLVRKNFVLIIDEINRGNVSQIFGELITLIEEDKRKGKGRDEALSITLPYSKRAFSVPDNLYIIGTMNTADRSVEALDTALRRRFVFEPMMPKPELLSPPRLLWEFLWKYKDDLWVSPEFKEIEKSAYPFFGTDETFEKEKEELWHDMETEGKNETQTDRLAKFTFTGVNLSVMLDTINLRLETLLSKDHTIGHAWLMNIYSLEDLRNVFQNKILPLLQEYFYNNYAKIGLVLGDNFVQEKTKGGQSLFASFKKGAEIADDYSDKIIYCFKDSAELTIQDFQSIYGQ